MTDTRIVKLALGTGVAVVALFIVPLLFFRGPAQRAPTPYPAGIADYRDQARLAQALATATQFKMMVTEYFFAHGEMPFNNRDLRLSAYAPYGDDALRDVVVEPQGVLRLTVRLADGRGDDVRLTPVYHQPSNSVRWICRTGNLPAIRSLLPDCAVAND